MTTLASSHTAPPQDLVPIRPFSELSIADVDYAGGKGANLGQLTRAGLPVPPGFVVGAPAYVAYRQQTGLGDRLAELLDSLDIDDTDALQQAAEEARQAVRDSEMPDWLAAAIGDAYGQLVGPDRDAPVAVRSSATAEDTASASFAGMNETFLNVRGREAVIDAVKRCWQSLFGARTIYYRGQRGFSHSGMEIAVVVQRQIPSTRAGVMFTIDPSTGNRDQLVIEGSFGLGESVVSGQVSPDRYVVDKGRMAILVRSVRPKELTIEVRPDGGTTKRELSPDESRRPVLTDEEVRRLAELGIAIEREYHAPQDTEWAFDPDGKIWMLQSRPITTVARSPEEPETGTPEGTTRATEGAELLRGLGAAPGQCERCGPPAAVACRRRQAVCGRCPGHPHDVSRLGAVDAQGGGDRHRLGGHDVPRGDRLPRTRDPRRGRHRRRDQEAPRRRAGHRRCDARCRPRGRGSQAADASRRLAEWPRPGRGADRHGHQAARQPVGAFAGGACRRA